MKLKTIGVYQDRVFFKGDEENKIFMFYVLGLDSQRTLYQMVLTSKEIEFDSSKDITQVEYKHEVIRLRIEAMLIVRDDIITMIGQTNVLNIRRWVDVMSRATKEEFLNLLLPPKERRIYAKIVG